MNARTVEHSLIPKKEESMFKIRRIKISKFWIGAILMFLALTIGIVLDTVFEAPKLV